MAVGFEEFFTAEYDRLARAMFLYTHDRDEAEDVAQEAFARVFERWDRVGAMESPTGYLFRTALNVHRKRLRRMMVRARRVLAERPAGDPTDDIAIRTDVAEAMSRLPEGQRAALLLTDWYGVDAQTAGALLGIEAVSVRSRVHRARASLREHLGAIEG